MAMKIIKLADALKDMTRVELAKAVREGKIFVYPTDTVYGIGCNAEKTASVEKIVKAKGRDPEKPLSVIAPSKEWIVENTAITSENVKFVDSLFPGPYTVVLRTKKKIPFVTSKEGSIGIRIPDNGFCDFIRSQGFLFITTSVNVSEENPVCSMRDIPDRIKNIVDYAIDSGRIEGGSSRVFDIRSNNLEILRW
jgi:L-threonylcarbamoyladenylate synthase